MTQMDEQHQQVESTRSVRRGERRSMLLGILQEAVADGVAHGMTEEAAAELAVKVLNDTMPQLAEPVTVSLHRDKRDLIAWLADERSQLMQQIAARWTSALTTYEAAMYLSYEIGVAVHDLYVHGPAPDAASDVAFLLHGRACTVAGEVLCLMRGGFEGGAIARRRTLHEIAVVMSVILEHPEHDLAQRYLDYSIVEQLGDMKNYQKYAEELGQTPFTTEEEAELQQQYDALLKHYGPHFYKKNRWAAPLFAEGKDVQFGMLEELAGLDHLSPYYKQSNHYIHAGPRAAVLNLYDTRSQTAIGVGARADGNFAEVGHGSLIALLQCTSSLVARVPAALEDPDNVLSLMCLERLTDDAGTAFFRASRR